MARKKVVDMTPSELEAHREYMRQAKEKSRKGKPQEKDNRGYRDRAEYMREYRKLKKEQDKTDTSINAASGSPRETTK